MLSELITVSELPAGLLTEGGVTVSEIMVLDDKSRVVFKTDLKEERVVKLNDRVEISLTVRIR